MTKWHKLKEKVVRREGQFDRKSKEPASQNDHMRPVIMATCRETLKEVLAWMAALEQEFP